VVPLLGREVHREDLPFEVLLAELQCPVDKVALKKRFCYFWEKAQSKMVNEM
jgi:hypothetical protein